ncbi:MAG: hypothetical protein KDG57_01385 [Rhodoferax sp.]|nr:hypothetical protein [Rhodoferax sp.]
MSADDRLKALERWLIEQEDIAKRNYSAAAMGNDVNRADMFANRARCFAVASEVLQEFIAENAL